MLIEDILQLSTGSRFHFSYITGHDQIVLTSLCDQISNGNPLTEKQRTLALLILNKNRDVLRPIIDNLDDHLDHPTWKHPFRVILQDKKISILEDKDQYGKPITDIFVEFPYDEEIVELIRKRNSEVNFDQKFMSTWDLKYKRWCFEFTESNICWIGFTLIPRGFQCDERFSELLQSIKVVQEEIEDNLPMLIKNENGFSLKNCHKNIPQLSSANLIETLFWARDYGITTWDNKIEQLCQTELNEVTKIVLSSDSWVDSNIHPISSFNDLINYGGRSLIIIPGGSELKLLREWVAFLTSIGIDTKQISVMFRLEKDKTDFNTFVNKEKLNNPINEDTKIAFVSTKISKPLIKSDVNFNTVINLGYYNVHFTLKTMVENSQNLVYYSLTAPK